MAKVYIISKSSHDYREAEKYGKLVFLSEGRMNRFCTNNIARQFEELMRESNPEDYILQTGLTVMNMIATAIFVAKHKRLNILLYDRGRYIERNLIFEGR